jgi:ABC-type Zn uptake system ZnuABC Zn-binding protein ZnuA
MADCVKCQHKECLFKDNKRKNCLILDAKQQKEAEYRPNISFITNNNAKEYWKRRYSDGSSIVVVG